MNSLVAGASCCCVTCCRRGSGYGDVGQREMVGLLCDGEGDRDHMSFMGEGEWHSRTDVAEMLLGCCEGGLVETGLRRPRRRRARLVANELVEKEAWSKYLFSTNKLKHCVSPPAFLRRHAIGRDRYQRSSNNLSLLQLMILTCSSFNDFLLEKVAKTKEMLSKQSKHTKQILSK